MNDVPDNPENGVAAGGEPGPAKRSRHERRAQAAADALRTFIRDFHMSRFGAVEPAAGELDIRLDLRVRPSEDWALRFEPPLAEQLLPQLEDAQACRNVYRKGMAHCFRCDSSECEHARPDSPLSVFKGYASNGVPEWIEFAQALIAARDARVERLYDTSPSAVAMVQLGSDLKDRQLSSFGKSSKTYSILGQVIAGYFPLRGRAENGGKIAVTLQAVEIRNEHGRMSLRLNTLAAPGVESLDDMLASGWQSGLHRAREVALRQLEMLEHRASAARGAGDADGVRHALRQVPVVLRRLAESIDRSSRQEGRRTRHVETRRQEQRPVHKALDDARAAGPDALFYDEKAGTTVVCGAQGRAHAFNPDGRHVTSFVLNPGAVAFRLRTRRWRAVTPDEAGRFRERIESFVSKRREEEPTNHTNTHE